MKTEMNEKSKEFYRERLSHYLRSHRDRHGLSQPEVAKQLGYTLDHYKRLEGAQEDRIANCIEFIRNFAFLDFDGDFVDFLIYLRNESRAEKSHDYPWAQNLIEAFAELSGDERREFMSQYCAKEKKGPWTLAALVGFSREMAQLAESDRTIIEIVLAILGRRKLTELEKRKFLQSLAEKL